MGLQEMNNTELDEAIKVIEGDVPHLSDYELVGAYYTACQMYADRCRTVVEAAQELSQLRKGEHETHVLVPKHTVDKLRIAEKALAQITVYDLFDCSAVEDTDFQQQAKEVYRIAETALKDMIKVGGQ